MINKYNSGILMPVFHDIKHFLRLMRILSFLLLVSMFCAHAENSYSQNKKVSINKNNVSLEEILNEVEKQTNYLFIYNNEVNLEQKVSVKVAGKTIKTMLDDLFSKTGITYSMEENHIILYRNKSTNPGQIDAIKKTITISGLVLDKAGEPIIGANVVVKGTIKGAVTDLSGAFKIAADSKAILEVTYIGYLKCEIPVENKKNLKIVLTEDSRNLDEVVVTAKTVDENVASVTMGVEKLSIGQIRKMPSLMGEVDIIKAIQLLPGVQTSGEGGSGFSVRGGSPDQNLILLDNTTVYNASHLMGFFSVFNNDVINDLELYKGDLPLKYGGRLSSLLDIKTIDKMPEKIIGSGGIGLISSRLMLQGPIEEKTSWLIGGRRSYADMFLKLSSDEDLKDLTLYFFDLNAKLTHRFSNKDILSLNSYYGQDKFGSDIFGFNYGNLATSLTWGHTFTDKMYSKFSLNLSNYSYNIQTDIDGATMDWKSRINDLMFRADFTNLINENHSLSYGLSVTHHNFTPGTVKTPEYGSYNVPHSYALESALYASNEHKITDRFTLKYGVRWTLFQNLGKATVYKYDSNHQVSDSTFYRSNDIYNTYNTIEPRFGAVYKLTDNSSIKANYTHNTQFIQLANSSSSGSPLDVWFLAGPNVKPQKVDMGSVGYFRNLNDNMFETSVELYYKSLTNVIDFADHADLILNEHLEGETRIGKGKAYGAEFMVRKNSGKLTGFVNYTLSRTDRTISGINNGKTYLSPYDKPHTLNIVLNYELSAKVSLSTTWVYSTGTPTTYPTGRFGVGDEYLPIYSGRNEFRKPDYHRLDLSCTYNPNPKSTKRYKSEWNVSIYNAYSRKNSYMITFDQDDITGIPFAESTYLFGFVPSITYNFKF